MIKPLLRLCAFLVMTSAIAQSGGSQPDLYLNWKSFRGGAFVSYDEQPGDAAYLLFTGQSGGKTLLVRSSRNYFVFLNGKVIGEYHGLRTFPIDSLGRLAGNPSFVLSIFQKNLTRKNLSTMVVTNAGVEQFSDRPPVFFNDFVIFSGLLIIILFVAAIRLNPKLANDYLSVQKIVSLREGDDSQSNARLTSSSNIQFYMISSMLLAFFLIITFRFLPEDRYLSSSFRVSSFAEAMTTWLFTTAFLLVIFGLKIIVISSLTRLFGLRGLARIHYFNWMRMLLFVLGTASLSSFIYLVSRGLSTAVFKGFLVAVVSIFVAWIAVVFLKLNSRSEHTMFHLFSYICATEIIPLLITIKVLFQ